MNTPLDNTDFVKKEFANASDRAAAIIGGAFVDELMTELLKSFLISDEASDKRLFSGSGLLATFSAKIDLAYRLGLISKTEHAAIHTIRSIRNTFAHEMGDASFVNQSIRDKCTNITIPQRMLVPDFVPPPLCVESSAPLRVAKDDPRGLFQEAISHYMRVLTARTIEATNTRRNSPKDFELAHETILVMLEKMQNIERNLFEVIAEAQTASAVSQAETAKQGLAVLQSHISNTELFIKQIKASHQKQHLPAGVFIDGLP